MHAPQLIKQLARISKLTAKEEREAAALLNNSKGVIELVTIYLEHQIVNIDKLLANPEKLYEQKDSDRYVTFRLAERAAYLKLHTLLTNEVKILDDDQSGGYNE